ncbi:winged helix DNA-binding domain-containing protein [Bacillus subtilis subsp. subtilis]|nr:winged helix DNA-binding domain-containing protein [Bacillus subtilis subsp. subtilis]
MQASPIGPHAVRDASTTSPLRRLALHSQGLASAQPFGAGQAGTRRAIEHLGYVQIDTLSVVERAHHHVLWNRVPGYDPAHLNRLVGDRQIFEYWYHAAAYLPMRDYRYALPRMLSIRNGESRYFSGGDQRLMKQILARVRADGPLRMRHLERATEEKGSWWNQGPGRRAFETLFMRGDLMVCERNGMEKSYDLAERCLPAGIDLSVPTLREYATHLLETTRRSHGVFTLKQLLHLRSGKELRDGMRAIVDERVDAGLLNVWKGKDGLTAYVDVAALEQPSRLRREVRILSPFDNLVIHRDRLGALFAFDYRVECYVAADKRVHGYFCLPILFGDRLVGRVDCKAHRGEQRLEVLRLHLEDGALDRDQFLPALRTALQRFAVFNRCPDLDARAVDRIR